MVTQSIYSNIKLSILDEHENQRRKHPSTYLTTSSPQTIYSFILSQIPSSPNYYQTPPHRHQIQIHHTTLPLLPFYKSYNPVKTLIKPIKPPPGQSPYVEPSWSNKIPYIVRSRHPSVKRSVDRKRHISFPPLRGCHEMQEMQRNATELKKKRRWDGMW